MEGKAAALQPFCFSFKPLKMFRTICVMTGSCNRNRSNPEFGSMHVVIGCHYLRFVFLCEASQSWVSVKKILLLAVGFSAGKPLGLIGTVNWKAIKWAQCWRGMALIAVYVKKKGKKKIFLCLLVSLARAGRSLAVCLFPWQPGPDLLDGFAGVRRCRSLPKLSKLFGARCCILTVFLKCFSTFQSSYSRSLRCIFEFAAPH